MRQASKASKTFKKAEVVLLCKSVSLERVRCAPLLNNHFQ
jgi:hypothetical protein